MENIEIFEPNSQKEKKDFDKRIFTKEFNILGRGSNGNLDIKPEKLEFGTVKVGFHKKMSFSIYNPTITNFYIKKLIVVKVIINIEVIYLSISWKEC